MTGLYLVRSKPLLADVSLVFGQCDRLANTHHTQQVQEAIILSKRINSQRNRENQTQQLPEEILKFSLSVVFLFSLCSTFVQCLSLSTFCVLVR